MSVVIQQRGAALREMCATFDATLEQWAVTQVKTVNATQQQLADQLAKDRATVHALEEQRKQLALQVRELQAQLEKETGELESLARTAQALQETESEFPPQLKQLQARKQKANVDLEAQKELLDAKRREKKEIMDDLNEGVALYEDNLGLAFDRISGGRLRCTFTLIDPRDDAKEFYFCVRIHDRTTYEVTDCVPKIESSKLDAIVYALNRTNDFSKFVRTMRSEFRQMVRS